MSDYQPPAREQPAQRRRTAPAEPSPADVDRDVAAGLALLKDVACLQEEKDARIRRLREEIDLLETERDAAVARERFLNEDVTVWFIPAPYLGSKGIVMHSEAYARHVWKMLVAAAGSEDVLRADKIEPPARCKAPHWANARPTPAEIAGHVESVIATVRRVFQVTVRTTADARVEALFRDKNAALAALAAVRVALAPKPGGIALKSVKITTQRFRDAAYTPSVWYQKGDAVSREKLLHKVLHPDSDE